MRCLGEIELAQIHIEEYGCSASQADSEMIAGMLKEQGHTIAKSSESADASVIVTCSVKDATAKRMMHRMRQLSSGPLVVAGCMPKAEPDTVAKFAPKASMMGPGSISRIPELVNAALSGNRMVALEGDEDKVGLPRVRLNPAVSIVEIASGCMSECSFCQTKLAKGDIKSYRTGDIVRQVQSDIKDGCCEVWLTSTDNGCYGFDIGTTLPKLLDSIRGVQGEFGIRVGMMNPMYMGRILDGLTDQFAKDSRIYRFLHIPVQSGSDKVLHDMKRGHTVKTFLEATRMMRKHFDDFTIATDIIVGYPTETDKDFEDTISLLKESKPDIVNLSKYSSRPGTEAAELDRIDEQETKRRSRTIHELARKIADENNRKWIGWRGQIRLVERGAEGGLVGRNYAYKQVVLDDSRDERLGQSVDVEIVKTGSHNLIAKRSAKNIRSHV